MRIDTFKLKLTITAENENAVNEATEKLRNGSTTEFWSSGNYNNMGRISNFRCSIGRKHLYLSGSLPKYYFGSNIKSMSADDIYDAFKRLSDELGLDISQTIVTELHIAHTLEVDCKPRLYYEYLGEHITLHRSNFTPDSLYYTSKGERKWKQINLYDKAKEAVSEITEESEYYNKNLLRAEIRLHSAPHRHLKLKRPLLVKDLWNSKIIKRLNEFWVDELNSIKRCEPIVEMKGLSKTSTPKETQEYLFAEMIRERQIDDPAYLEKIFMSTKTSNCYKGCTHNYIRLRKQIQKQIDKYSRTERNSLEQELTSKINAVLK